jgi:hypothetical protein
VKPPRWAPSARRAESGGSAGPSGDGRLLDALLVGAVLGLLAVTPAVLALAWLTDDASLPVQRLLVTCVGIAAGLSAGAVRHRRSQQRP